MRIIFLDIDGVLNSAAFAHEHTEHWERLAGSAVDPVACQRLNRLIAATNVKVVISSSWRILLSIVEIERILRAGGCDFEIIGVTPRLGTRRGNEIQRWLNECEKSGNWRVESFVIFDDDADMEHLLPRLVQTDWDFGLQDVHVDRAIAILKPKVSGVVYFHS